MRTEGPKRGLNSLGLVILIYTSISFVLLSSFQPAASQDENLSPSTSVFSSSEITVTKAVTFEWPVVSGTDNYDLIDVRDCRYLENIGEPRLPVKNVFLLIPPAATLADVEVTSLAENTLEGEYFIFPAQPPLRTIPENRSFVAPDPLIYKSSGRYPKKLFSLTKAGNLGGHRILGIRIFPVQYVPKSGEIIFHSEISIKVTYSLNDTTPTDMASPSAEFSGLVKKLVLNPESGDGYNSSVSVSGSSTAAGATLPSDDVKYVIITSESLEDNFQVLADWKTKKGAPAKVVTVSWITDNYPGVDNQEKIRNFIKDAAENWGTTWVLLGGDTNIIPVRKGYGEVEGEAAGVDKDNIPADLYYSGLDGNWNADNDDTYGEVEDNVDLYPDVFVGRAPVDSAAEAQTFVDKTLKYERDPPAGYQKTVLFLAEILKQDPYTDGGIAKDVVDNNNIPDGFSVTKLYESSGNLNHNTAMDNLNSGYGIVNHVGHANYSVLCVGPNNLYRSDMDSLVNSPKYSVFYSIGCWSAAMDRDSIGARFVLSEDGGGPVYVGNSRYGWFTPGDPGGGSSDLYDQEFFNSLLVENFYRVGETLADSKIEFIPESENDGAKRWLQYALNLLGDPELPIWTEAPENLFVTHPSEVLTGSRQVTVTVKDNDGSAVENALVCLQKDPDVYTYGYTNPSGEVTFSISPTSPGSLNVTVTKHNFLSYENTVSVGGWIYFSDTLLVKPSETHAVDLRHGQVDITFDVKLDWIQTAENYIDIEMWNMWHYDEGPVRELYDALIESAGRGVKVRILIGLEECYNQVKYLNDYENITVLKSASDGTHSKYMIVDERRVTIGSTNWSWAAMVQNREFNLCIKNKDVALAYTYLFENVWGASGGSIRGTGEYWECENLKPLAHDDYVPPEFTTIYDYNTQRIDEAENEILISLYAYRPSDPDVEQEFQNRLIAAADRGGTIKLVVNHHCYNGLNKEKIDELAGENNTYVKVIDLTSAPPWDHYGCSHPKIFLVDGCKGSVSSMNWDQYVFDNAGRDVGVGFNNSELCDLIEECFYYTWNAPDAYWAEGQDPIPPSDIIAPSVKTVSVENITYTSATFKGELLDDGGSDRVNVYFLFQVTASDNRYWDYYHPIERVADPCTFQYTVENLKPMTEYMMVAQASNEAERVRGEKLYFTTKMVGVSISPPENVGLPGENVVFNVMVTNNGGAVDNFLLENVDNCGWFLELENELLEIPAGENCTTTLTVTIPENAELGIEDEITVIAILQEDENVRDNASCIVRVIPPKAELSLATLYEVGLDLNLYLENGSKLVVKFYTYTGDNQGENVAWENVMPAHVILLENIPHPLGEPVENSVLVLTTDNTADEISEIASFTVHRSDLRRRIVAILLKWPGNPGLRDAFRREITQILFQWPSAPP